MYSVRIGTVYIHDPHLADVQLYDVGIRCDANDVSTCTMTVPVGHPHADMIRVKDMSRHVTVWDDDRCIFEGYVWETRELISGDVQVTCRGGLAWLEDTILPPYSTVEGEAANTAPSSPSSLLRWYVDRHNERATQLQRVEVGTNDGDLLDPNAYVYRSSTQRPSTLGEIRDKLIEPLGGVMLTRWDGMTRHLDWHAECSGASTQVIDFGVNLTDYLRSETADGSATAVVAIGGTPEGEDEPITLDGMDEGEVAPGIMLADGALWSVDDVSRHGWSCVVYRSDALTQEGLLASALAALRGYLSMRVTVEADAVDLALLGAAEPLMVGEYVRVRSRPHGIDEYMLVTGADLDLGDPGKSRYTLGAPRGGYSEQLRRLNASINASVDAVAALSDEVKGIGIDASSLSASVEQTETGAVITVTDKDGTTQAEITNGEGGVGQATIYLHTRASGVRWSIRDHALYAVDSTALSVTGTSARMAGSVTGHGIRLSGSVVASPDEDMTYRMSTGELTGNLGAWSRGVPSGNAPLWVIVAHVESAEDVVTIRPEEWSAPVIMAENGKSIYVASSTKQDGTTTVTLSDGTILVIEDGTDGDTGTPGKNGYVHVAWATSADGSQGFSTTVSAGKTYLGVYTDNTEADSTDYRDYSWSLIKGAKGDQGPQGEQGAKGDKGAKGDTGPQGEKGDTGADGQMLVATSTTAVGTAAKVATLKSGTLSLKAGASVTVIFSNANTAASPTLNVSSTGAKAIRTNGMPYAYWVAGTAVSFVYDGTYWQTCSVPVYASTVTVGNPAGRNVYIDSDSLDIRSGSTVMADFHSDVINLGKNSTSSKVTFSGGVGNVWQSGSSMRLGSDKGVYLQVGSSDTGDDRGMGFLPDGDGTMACVRSESFVYNTGNVYAGTVLFDGDADGSVTLSESCANFDYIDIMYEVEDASEGAIWGSKRVSSPNGKQVGLEVVIAIRQGGAGTNPNVIQLQTRNYRFNGKSLVPFSSAVMNYANTGELYFFGTSDKIHVRHVIGWRK